MEHQEQTSENRYDLSVIRPKRVADDIQIRGRQMPKAHRSAIRKALRTFHRLEIMAVNIYRYQVTTTPDEKNRQLIIAMNNEMTHVQDFQSKLCEFGFTPSPFRWAFWLAGRILGTVSRIAGEKTVYKTDIWVETKAIHHYSHLLDSVPWDDDSREMIRKNQADELGHIQRWQSLLSDTK